MGVGFAPTWLRQVTPPMLHMTTLTTAIDATDQRCRRLHACIRPTGGHYECSLWCKLVKRFKLSLNLMLHNTFLSDYR